MTIADLRTRLSAVQAAQLTVYGEARNQPVLGLVAVLGVIGNRVRLQIRGTTWPTVCFAAAQFSCWNLDDPNRPRLETLAELMLDGGTLPDDPILDVCGYLAERAVAGTLSDPTQGATHYFNPDAVPVPAWARAPAVRTTTIGSHSFYRHVA